MTNASGIHHTHGPMAFCSVFLWIEWLVRRTTQRAIWLLREVCSSKDSLSGCAGPLWRPVDDRSRDLLCKLDEWLRFGLGKHSGPHGCGMQMMTQFQTK